MKLSMSRLRKARFLVMIGLVLVGAQFFCIFSVYAQDSKAKLDVSLRQKTFRVGEPVIIELSLVNQGEKPVKLREPALATNDLLCFIRKGDGPFEKYQLHYIIEPCCSVELAPGETFRSKELIQFNYATGNLAFPEPGDYTVKVEFPYFVGGTQLEPAEISFEVIKNSRKDKRIAEFFSEEEVANFISGTSIDERVIKRMEAMVKKYPKSLFSQYGRYYLALHHARRLSQKEPQFKQAIELMKKANAASWQFEPDALFYLSAWSWQVGKSEESLTYLNQLIKKFPESSASQAATRFRENISGVEPPSPVKESVSIDKKTERAIRTTMEKYFRAFERRDIDACAARLAEEFRYNEALEKTATLEEIKEDFSRLEADVILSANWEVEKMEMVDAVPLATIKLTYFLGKDPLTPPRTMQIGFIKKDGQWFFKSLRTIGR